MTDIIIVEEKDNFILTKWYVNLKDVQKALDNAKNFILTKWYVNPDDIMEFVNHLSISY